MGERYELVRGRMFRKGTFDGHLARERPDAPSVDLQTRVVRKHLEERFEVAASNAKVVPLDVVPQHIVGLEHAEHASVASATAQGDRPRDGLATDQQTHEMSVHKPGLD